MPGPATSSESTHPSLLARVRNPADRAAWRQFEARYGALILGYCRSVGLQLADAEDVRQEVMLSLARTMPSFTYNRQLGRFRSYLGSTVRHAVIRHAERHKQKLAGLDSLGTDPADPRGGETDALWERQWVMHHCQDALARLRRSADPRHLDIFERLMQGQSSNQIAAELGITGEAVRKIKQRIRDRLHELVAEQIRDEEGGRPPGHDSL